MSKFVIPEGRAFECIFPVKEPNSPTPMDLTGASGTFTMSTIGVGPCIVLDNIPMTVYDALNGKFKLTLTAEQTTGLVSSEAFEEDGFPLSATYKALLEINQPEFGQIFASIPQIYILNTGSACPAT